ncbi:endoplasmic reticulum vesicle 25 protein [Rutstroemia sp. NJR-2017a BVV2]|nr:endoplasmic reticulum vesicle 25 protein [Rutstroemia sp. NJR-2017a BVV2]
MAFFLVLALANALKFDIDAFHKGDKRAERCIRNFVARDTLVVVTATIDGWKGDGMQVDMHIKDAVGNEYGRPRDIVGEKRMAFTSLADASFDVCFENHFAGSGRVNGHPSRHIELDIDIGADAKDWNAVQATEKLKPVETELRRIEEMVQEIVAEMDYLRQREQKLRDTNESTNNRVKWFAFGTMGMLVSLGAWQIVYLRAYFRDDDWDDGWLWWRDLPADETLVLLVSRGYMYNGMRRKKSSYRMRAPGKDIDIKVISFKNFKMLFDSVSSVLVVIT